MPALASALTFMAFLSGACGESQGLLAPRVDSFLRSTALGDSSIHASSIFNVKSSTVPTAAYLKGRSQSTQPRTDLRFVMPTHCRENGCNCTGKQHFPSLLNAEHVSVLYARAKTFSPNTDAPTTISNDDLHAKLLSIAKKTFFDKHGYVYAESETLPPDLKPDTSPRTLRGFVTIPLDNLQQARKCSDQVLNTEGNPGWFVEQFVNEIAVRAEEVFNVSDPDRWEKSGLKATYGNPDDRDDRVEVRTVYLYTNIVSSEGTVHIVVYYVGIYYSTKQTE